MCTILKFCHIKFPKKRFMLRRQTMAHFSDPKNKDLGYCDAFTFNAGTFSVACQAGLQHTVCHLRIHVTRLSFVILFAEKKMHPVSGIQ